MKANNIEMLKRAEEIAFRYSELAYNEACKPKDQQDQEVIDRYLIGAKVLTKHLISNGFWEERN
jgi:hypothetical protein